VIGLLADDLTGACDSAAPFLGEGRVLVSIWPAFAPDSSAACLAISTETRDGTPEEARTRSRQAVHLLLTAGALGDRFDRRKVMIWSEAISASFFVAMVFVHAPTTLIVLAFGSAIAELPFFSASRAAIPNLVASEDQISWANGLVTMGVHAGIAVGPVLGGLLLIPFGVSGVFALNAVTFGVSLVLTLTVHGNFQEDRTADRAAPTDHDPGILAGLAGVGLLAGGGVGGVDPLWALVLLGGAFAWAVGSAQGTTWLVVLANVGFLLNAFNLLPIGFLDGGSVFRAISESRRGWIRHENGIPVEAVRPDREQATHITVLYILVAAALVACLLATRQSGML